MHFLEAEPGVLAWLAFALSTEQSQDSCFPLRLETNKFAFSCRMPNLTYLKLSLAIWKAPLIQESSTPKLRKLVLVQLEFEEGPLNQCLQALTQLTELDLWLEDREHPLQGPLQGPHLKLPQSLR